jgi:hypothetical protein
MRFRGTLLAAFLVGMPFTADAQFWHSSDTDDFLGSETVASYPEQLRSTGQAALSATQPLSVEDAVQLLREVATQFAGALNDSETPLPPGGDIVSRRFFIIADALSTAGFVYFDMQPTLQELQSVSEDTDLDDYQRLNRYISLSTKLLTNMYELQGDLAGLLLPLLGISGIEGSVVSLFVFQASLVLEFEFALVHGIGLSVIHYADWLNRFQRIAPPLGTCARRAEIVANIRHSCTCSTNEFGFNLCDQARSWVSSNCGLMQDVESSAVEA